MDKEDDLGVFARISKKYNNAVGGGGYVSRAYLFDAKRISSIYSSETVQPTSIMVLNLVRI